MQRRKRPLSAFAALTTVTLLLAACTNNPEPAASESQSAQTARTVFTFGTAASPVTLDPALVTDIDSSRITRQIFEGLVTVDPNTSQPTPALATSWQVNDNAKDNSTTYQFELRSGVTFQDGTPFNAEAVCYNFERWFNYPVQENPLNQPSVFRDVFKAFASDTGKSLYSGCTTQGELSVQIALSSTMTGFLEALTSPAFAIASPTALKNGTADRFDQKVPSKNSPTAQSTAQSTEATEKPDSLASTFGLNPVGTGPYRFVSWQGDTVILQRNDSYWGDAGSLTSLVFVAYPYQYSRLQALLRGDIDGYDFVTTDNLDSLVKGGFQVLQRDPFSVMYLGFNQSNSILANQDIRRAAAMAVDKQSLVNNYFIDGTATTAQFVPPKLSGFNNKVSGIDYNPSAAKDLLKQSGYQGEPIPFYYPTQGTRSYMPAPEKIYADISAQLTAAGFTIDPVPIEWSNGYLDAIRSGQGTGFYLLGVNGAYSDPDNFLGPLFGAENPALGFNDRQIINQVQAARSLSDEKARTEAYQQINTELADSVPALPIAFPISAVALAPYVSDYPLSPVLNEVFTSIKLDQ